MQVTEIIKLACAYLGIFNDYKTYFSLTSSDDNAESQETSVEVPLEKQEELELLIISLNNTLEKVSKILNLNSKEVFNLTSNKINFSNFSKKVNKILYVKNVKDGKILKFKVYDNVLQLPVSKVGCEVEVEYTYILPKIETILDEININCFIGESVLALGVAGEFCFISGIFDDAEMWNNKFVSEVENQAQRLSQISFEGIKNFIMPKRNWR